MQEILVVNSRGEKRNVEVASEDVAFELTDHSVFAPAVAQRVEYDHTGQISKVTHATRCIGDKTENRREADDKPAITIEGIATEGQLATLKSLKHERQLALISDVHNGYVSVSRVTIRQSSDLVYFYPNGSERQLAFTFHLQLLEQ